jgi:dGTPase
VSCEILEGLLKHRTPHDHPDVILPRSPSLEAQAVNLADEIAYTAHDTDDGLRAGLFTVEDSASTALGRLAHGKALERSTELRGAIVDLLVTDLYAESGKTLMSQKILTLEDVYHAKSALITFSSAMETMLIEHRTFLWQRLYKSPSVLRQAEHGRKTITKLFAAYMAKPTMKVKELQKRTGSDLYEAVKDYIAGMTDTFALESLAAL